MDLVDRCILEITPNIETNGCGPKGYGWLVPDNFGTVSFTQAANIHDAQYSWIIRIREDGGEFLLLHNKRLFESLENGKDYSDKIFRKNMMLTNKLRSRNQITRLMRIPIIDLYYRAVVMFGEPMKDFV